MTLTNKANTNIKPLQPIEIAFQGISLKGLEQWYKFIPTYSSIKFINLHANTRSNCMFKG